MTGAGSSDVAFVKGTGNDLIDIPGSPTYYEPGVDPVLQDLTLDRALSRLRKPGQVFPDQSVAGNIEGGFGLEFVVDSNRLTDVHDIVFSQTSGTVLTSGRPPTSRWFVGVDYISGTAERVLKGCVPTDFEIAYGQGDRIRATATFLYADEESNASITPPSVTQADGDAVAFHGGELSLDGTVQSKEQSFTLSITDISRFHRGSQAVAVDATVAAPVASLSANTIITETDQLELAYGGGGQTTTSETMDATSGTVTLSDSGGQVAQYSLSEVKPASHAWQDVIAADTDTTEQIEFNVDGVSL